MYDILIAGAGPAGMTAAVYAARKSLRTLLVSKNVGGQVLWSTGIDNYMGYQYIEGFELIQKFEDQVKKFPIEQSIGKEIVRLSRLDNRYEVILDSGERYESKTVIIATGKRPRQLNVPGEEALKGRGVTYCAVCDGPLFAGDRVAVIGGGNSALEAVDDMVKIAEHVFLVSLTQLTGDEILINKVNSAPNLTVFLRHEVLEITGSNRVENILLKNLESGDETTIDVGAVFIEIGLIPNSDIVRDVVKLNEFNEIEASCSCETDVPGLFAAGDVTNIPDKQIVVAAGEGAKAALQAHRYLQRHYL